MKVFTTAEVAKLLHCSEEKIAALRTLGFLPMVKTGQGWITTEKWVEEFLDKHKFEDLGSLK